MTQNEKKNLLNLLDLPPLTHLFLVGHTSKHFPNSFYNAFFFIFLNKQSLPKDQKGEAKLLKARQWWHTL